MDEYAKNSIYQTPLENPYVRKLLEELGFETVEELLGGQHAADQRILAALVAKNACFIV
mgnify:CR=1 FL=1